MSKIRPKGQGTLCWVGADKDTVMAVTPELPGLGRRRTRRFKAASNGEDDLARAWEAAEAWLRDELAKLKDGIDAQGDLEPFGSVLARMFEERRRRANEHQRSLITKLKSHMRMAAVPVDRRGRTLITVPVGRLTLDDFQQLADVVVGDLGMARTSMQHALSWYRSCLDRLVGTAIRRNPLRGDAVEIEHEPKVSVVLSRDQVTAFVEESLKHRWGPALILAVTTGLRHGEVRGLRWSDVDWHRGLLKVERSISQSGGRIGPTKGRRARMVPLEPPVLALLRQQLNRRPGETWIFTSDKTGLPIGYGRIFSQFERVGAAIGAPPGMRLHDLRHTFATIALSDGVPVHEVSAILGHASPDITMKVYAHLLETNLRRATGALSDLMPEIAGESEIPTTGAAEDAPAPVVSLGRVRRRYGKPAVQVGARRLACVVCGTEYIRTVQETIERPVRGVARSRSCASSKRGRALVEQALSKRSKEA